MAISNETSARGSPVLPAIGLVHWYREAPAGRRIQISRASLTYTRPSGVLAGIVGKALSTLLRVVAGATVVWSGFMTLTSNIFAAVDVDESLCSHMPAGSVSFDVGSTHSTCTVVPRAMNELSRATSGE